MRVHLIPGLLGDNRPSMERYVGGLAQWLPRNVPDLEVSTLDTCVHPLAKRVRRPWLLSRAFVYADRFIRYPRHLRGPDADVYHVTDHTYAYLIRWLPAARTVVTVHDLIPIIGDEDTHKRSPLTKAISLQLQRWDALHLRYAAHIVAVSENTRRDILRFTNVCEQRVSVVPNGLDEQFVPLHDPTRRTVFRQRLNAVDAYLVLHVGTNLPYKNIPTLFRVVYVLVKEHDMNVILLKVGEPFDPVQIAMLESLGILDRVRCLERIDDNTLVTAYQAADLVLYPSTYEGFGWPVLEAMACGVPVIASNRGSLSEVAGQAALLFDPFDVAGMVTAARRVLVDTSLRNRLVELGLKQAALFSWERTATELINIYQSIDEKASS